MNKTNLLSRKIKPFNPREVNSIEDALIAFQSCSFQARNLGKALDILSEMMEDQKCMRVLCLSGAMIPAGLEELICQMIEEKVIHFIVTTGANIIHSILNSFDQDNQAHYIGHPDANDIELNKHGIDRIYDVFVTESSYEKTEDMLEQLIAKLFPRNKRHILTPSQFFSKLGKHLKGRCFIKIAAEYGVPIFNPAFSDSELGMDMIHFKAYKEMDIIIDNVKDIDIFAKHLLRNHGTRYGSIIVGGGVPRNWAQQVFPYLQYLLKRQREKVDDESLYSGYMYSVRFHSAIPQDGGLSGCTVSEGISWGKYSHKAKYVSVWGDATISFPLAITALFQRMARKE
mgnify:CR=1 FL=1